jgi:putative ABC transport system permease protein
MTGPLWLRGMRSRPLVNALLLVLVSTAVATAVLGPLLIRAVQQFTLQAAVDTAPIAQTSIRVSEDLSGESPNLLGDYRAEAWVVEGLVSRALTRSGSTAWLEPLVDTVSVGNTTWAAGGKGDVSSRVVAVEECTGYAITTGRCPDRPGQVMLSTTAARRAGLAPGQPLTLTRLESGSLRLRVVGLYDPPASDHGQLVRPGTSSGELARVTADPLVVEIEQAAELRLAATVSAQIGIAPGVTADDVAGLRATVAAVETAVSDVPAALGVDSAVPTLLDRVERQARAAALLMGVTVAQAVLLALFATATVLQRVARTRAPEWGIGRLRGVPRRRWLTSVYAEPGLVLLAGLPLGYAAGTAIARAAVTRHLDPATPVEPYRWPVLAVAALAALGALLALVAVSVRSVRRPLPELISTVTEPRRLTVLGAVAQAAIVLLAGASLYQLLAGRDLTQERSLFGLLAPALFALALSVLAVRGGVLVVRLVTRRPPRSLAAVVVGRQTARTPSSLNPAIVLAAGTALAVFATQVVVLANRNADLRAAVVVGADQVLGVSVPPGTDLATAVRKADPGGTWAMAAQEVIGSAGTGRIVAVDTTRLTEVSAWSTQWAGVPDPAAALRPVTGPSLRLRGRTLTIGLANVVVQYLGDDSDLFSTGQGKRVPPLLQVTVDTGRTWRTVDLGTLGPTSATLRGAVPCAAGCRLVSIGVNQRFPTPYTASLTVAALATDQQPAAELAGWLTEAGRWRAVVGEQVSLDPSQSVQVSADPDGLDLAVTDNTGRQATRVTPTDTEEPVRAVVGPKVLLAPVPGQPDVISGSGLDGGAQQVRVLGRAAVLPRSVDDGVLTDLVNAQRLVDPAQVDAVNQVWVRSGAPPEVEQRLTAAGVGVQSRELLADQAGELRREAVPRAAVLSVWVAALALLLSVVVLVAARVADAGRRRRDWLALRQAGLPRRTLRRLALAEIALPALIGAATGLLAGLGAVRLAAERLPLTDAEAPGPPLDLALAWGPAAGLGLVLLVVLAVVAAVGAAVETRRGRHR